MPLLCAYHFHVNTICYNNNNELITMKISVTFATEWHRILPYCLEFATQCFNVSNGCPGHHVSVPFYFIVLIKKQIVLGIYVYIFLFGSEGFFSSLEKQTCHSSELQLVLFRFLVLSVNPKKKS